MRSILAILFLSCLTCFGQFGVEQPFFAQSSVVSFSPQSIPGLAYWWKASDLTNSPVDHWVDKVQGIDFFATTNKPIWSTNKLQFYGTNWLQVETAIPAKGSNDAFMVVFSQRQPSAAGGILGSTNTADHLSVLATANAIRWGAATYFNLNDNVVTDFIYDQPTPNPAYTNTVYLGNLGSQNVTGIKYFGVHVPPSTAPFSGDLYEVAIWTNSTLGTNYIAMLHNYATNLYGFGPP